MTGLREPSTDQRIGIFRVFFSLAGLEGLLAFVQLVSLPGGAGRFPSGRLLLLVPVMLVTVAFFWAALRSWRSPTAIARQATRLADLTRQKGVYWGTLGLCSVAFLVCFYILLLNWWDSDPYVLSYLARLAPFALWVAFLSLQSMVALRWMRYGADLHIFERQRTALIAASIAFIALLLLSAWMIWTKIGLAPDIVAWGEPGVPILPAQIVAALAITFAIVLLGSLALTGLRKSGRQGDEAVSRAEGEIASPGKERRVRNDESSSLGAPGLSARTIDLLACLCLWGVAVWRWGAEPLRPSYFSPAPVPPNQEYYPYSDAAVYDSAAQSLLIGYGLGEEAARPLYSFFLAVAQAFNGIGYQNALAWQIPLLALIPPLLYLLARALHNRISGFFVGLLAVLHESNSIALADIANVSHAKLLMSDMPTALGVVAATAVLVLWAVKPGSRKVHPLLAGGILALAVLVRVQTIVLLPVMLVVVWVANRRYGRVWPNLSLLAGGFLCVFIPWLWRNWQVSGKVFLSETSRASQIGLIGQRYSLGIDPQQGQRLPGEANDAYAGRMVRSALRFVQEHPAETTRFLAAHFLHNEVATMLVLPSRFTLAEFLTEFTNGTVLGQDPNAPAVWERCCSLRAYVKNLGYWSNWGGVLAARSGLPLLAGLFLIAVGIGTAWKYGRVAGLIPLAVNVAYSLSNALVRNSGWRFNLPVDWIGYLYYGIGLVQLCLWGLAFFRNREVLPEPGVPEVKTERGSTSRFPWGQVILAGAFFFLISAAIPITESAIPERFRNDNVQSLLESLQEKGVFTPLGIDGKMLVAFLSQDGAEALIGRGLYPRYHLAGQGEPGSGWPSYTPRDYNRLGFLVIGPQQRQVVLRTPTPPSYFPHASDVLVLGCSMGDYLDASLVVFLNSPDIILARSPLDEWTCPGPE